MNRYVIVRSHEPEEVVRGPVAQPAGPSRVDVQVADLSEAEAADAARDPRNAVAPAAMPLRLIAPEAVPEGEGSTWGLEAIGADQCPLTGKGAKVAVLDTGLAKDHPAFADVEVVGRNFTNGDPNDFRDDDGHGTHCAGTICGGTVDGTRIGVAPGIDQLVVGKVLGPGGGDNATILEAIHWATQQGATIVSMSLGIDFPGWVEALAELHGLPLPRATSMALRDYRWTVAAFGKLADYLAFRGTLLVAATGNESERPTYTIDVAPPAASEHVIKVGAVGGSKNSWRVAGFSNTGPDLVGPGVGVQSADRRGGLVSLSGTSMATPHVAGVAALWAERLGEQALREVIAAKLVAGANTDGASGAPQRLDVGAGMVRVP